HEGFRRAIEARDADACARYYAGGAVLVPPSGPIVSGRAEIVASLTAAFEQGALGSRLGSDEVVIRGSEAYASGNFAMHTRSSLPRGRGTYTEIWRLADGQWRIVYHVFGTVSQR